GHVARTLSRPDEAMTPEVIMGLAGRTRGSPLARASALDARDPRMPSSHEVLHRPRRAHREGSPAPRSANSPGRVAGLTIPRGKPPRPFDLLIACLACGRRTPGLMPNSKEFVDLALCLNFDKFWKARMLFQKHRGIHDQPSRKNLADLEFFWDMPR